MKCCTERQLVETPALGLHAKEEIMPRTLSILLVEDDAAHVALIKRGIKKFDSAINLIPVSSLAHARRYLKQLTPDIAIVDLKLPDGSGTELLEEYSAMPIIILTGHDSEEAEMRSLQAGATAYIVKTEKTFKNLPQIVLKAHQAWLLNKESFRADVNRTHNAELQTVYKLNRPHFSKASPGESLSVYSKP